MVIQRSYESARGWLLCRCHCDTAACSNFVLLLFCVCYEESVGYTIFYFNLV